MVKSATQERRSSVRAKRVLSIQFRLIKTKRKNADKSWKLSTTQDMSYGGLAFYTDCEFKPGEILEIHVVMSGLLDIFKGQAKVVRAERKKAAAHYLIGIKLLRNDVKSRRAKSYSPASKKRSKRV